MAETDSRVENALRAGGAPDRDNVSKGEGLPKAHASRELRQENVRLDDLNKKLSVFAAVIESTDDAILTQDLQGVIESWNPAAERLFGYTKEEAIGRGCSLLAAPETGDPIPELIAGAAAGRPVRNVEALQRRKDGVRVHVALTVSPVREPSGKTIGASTIARDITGRKRTEELLAQRAAELSESNASLAQQARQLSHSNEEMEQLVYIVSHDLKSPLVTIGGFADRLTSYLERGDQEKLKSSVGRIQRAVGRMTQLIDDLLVVSRIGRGRGEPEEIDISSLIRELHEDLSSRLRAAHARLRVADGMPRICMERSQAQQVFENLLTNAIKYGCEDGRGEIEAGFEKTCEEIRFFVRDHGPGIPAGQQEQIFHLFRRLQSGGEGSGVGLAIVSKVVKLQGGRVWVDSAPGEGATFWVALPRGAVQSGEE